ncbi:MAG: chemotaxis protein CheW [Phycisphaerae bacterium]|nr:chemotaxis protein CheW [Phycisphaerae bacterium]
MAVADGLAPDDQRAESPSTEIGVGDRLRALLARPISEAELDENTAVVATSPRRREATARALLVVRLGGERLGFDVRFARRVVSVAQPHRVPHRDHNGFAGIANVDGELVLAVRLERLFDLERSNAETALRRHVVLGDEGQGWAIEVDRVEGVRRFEASRLLTPPATVGRALESMTEALADTGDGEPLVSVLATDRVRRALERCIA